MLVGTGETDRQGAWSEVVDSGVAGERDHMGACPVKMAETIGAETIDLERIQVHPTGLV